MERKDFFASVDVNGFVGWLVNNLPLLHIHLKINSSRFVPNGIDVVCNGFNQVIHHYIWRSTGIDKGDWIETRTKLNALSAEIRAATDRKDESETLLACQNILVWGGNRNPAVGALPFLRSMSGGSLSKYIASAGANFFLSTADTNALVPPVTRMNAMLTKVHALYASDGLPIYDSRVAAAIASLVELWRRSTGYDGVLPPELSFPATTATRTVLRLFPDAGHPGVLVHGAEATTQKWSSAKVRLGWIISEVLEKAPNTVLPNHSVNLQERMRAFEASLFMIGYDVRSLSNPDLGSIERAYCKRFSKLSREIKTSMHLDKTTSLLFRRAKKIRYTGDISSGFEIKWGEVSFYLEAEVTEALLSQLAQKKNVPLGANMTGVVAADSLGKWLTDNGWPSRRYASAIAAVLANEGFVQRSKRTNCLDFIRSGETKLEQ